MLILTHSWWNTVSYLVCVGSTLIEKGRFATIDDICTRVNFILIALLEYIGKLSLYSFRVSDPLDVKIIVLQLPCKIYNLCVAMPGCKNHHGSCIVQNYMVSVTRSIESSSLWAFWWEDRCWKFLQNFLETYTWNKNVVSSEKYCSAKHTMVIT